MSELQTLWLPLSIAGLALLVLVVDVFTPPRREEEATPDVGWLVAVGLAGLLVATFFVDGSGTAAFGAYQGSAWTKFLQRVFLVSGLLAALGGLDDVAKRMNRRQGEYWLVLLCSLLGMVLVPGSRSLLLLIVAFELMSVPLYVLAAYAKTEGEPEERTRASEAALKLYFVGATSTAITFFGLALVTGMAGSMQIADLVSMQMTPLAAVGLLFVLGGLGYKIGMVPFHMWVPDTYQGARAPFVAFLSVAPKAAGMSVLAVLYAVGLRAHQSTFLQPISLIALLSMAIGNVLALPQTDLRRVLGYSGIAQMGYVLVAFAAGDEMSMGMILFFLAAYLFTNLGAFLVLHAAAEAGGGFTYDTFAGFAKRSPGLAVSLACFLLSLAGIPFVVGFWAKLYVFLAAWRAGLYGLVSAAIVLAVIGLFYYLRILRAAYMVEADDRPKVVIGTPLRFAIALCVAGVVGFGLWPAPLLASATGASHALFAEGK